MPRTTNDIAPCPSLHTLAELLACYWRCRKAGHNHKRSVHYAFVQAVGYAWHSGDKHFAVGKQLASVKRSKWYRGVAPPKIDVSLARWNRLCVNSCGAVPSRDVPAKFPAWNAGKVGTGHTGWRPGPHCCGEERHARKAILKLVLKHKPELAAQTRAAFHNYKNITGTNLFAVDVLFGSTTARRQWAKCERARQLFIKGWGGFQATPQYGFQTCEQVAASGYGFIDVRHFQLAKSKPWRAWFTRHWQWWKTETGRIDELQLGYSDYSVAIAYLQEHPDCTPQGLLTHIADLRARRDAERWQGDKPAGQPLALPYNWLADVPPQPVNLPDGTRGYIAPVRTGNELVTVADSLSNCAANYHADVCERECMLIACIDQTGKPIGLAELLPDGTFGQIAGPNNKALPAAIKQLFHQYQPVAMRAVWVGDAPAIEPPTVDAIGVRELPCE